MKLERTLAVVKMNKDEKGIDLTAHLSGCERLSLLEKLRQEMAIVTNHEYPQRLRRVLEIAKRRTG